jgi:hypothetical protein
MTIARTRRMKEGGWVSLIRTDKPDFSVRRCELRSAKNANENFESRI